jgi:NAD(P)-dependent dehydrogenase (short-subunit alcohol dehydrogenase family)
MSFLEQFWERFTPCGESSAMKASRQAKTIVITGASAGLGRATVRAFARQGARIGLLARGRDGLNATAQEVEELGGQALPVPTDVAQADQVEMAADAVEERFGPIDVWINNAMISVFAPATQIAPAEYKRVTEVNYLGYVYGTLAALQRMIARDRGLIIQVGSALAYRGIPLQAAYCASKHAIEGFTESVRCELLHDGSNVKITMLQMPALNTPHFGVARSRLPRRAQPVPPIYQPEVAAEAIVWASDHYRREWYVGGSTVFAIVGNKLVPGLADHYLAWQGYDSQQYDGREDPNRPDNIDQPVPGDRGAHGQFGDRAHERSWQLLLTQHRGWLLAAGAITAACWIARDRIASERLSSPSTT